MDLNLFGKGPPDYPYLYRCRQVQQAVQAGRPSLALKFQGADFIHNDQICFAASANRQGVFSLFHAKGIEHEGDGPQARHPHGKKMPFAGIELKELKAASHLVFPEAGACNACNLSSMAPGLLGNLQN